MQSRYVIDALVPNSELSGLPGQAANRPSQQQPREQEPITHAFEISTNFNFRCQEHRSFYPELNYEVVQLQTTVRNANTPPDVFHIIKFPIDQLGPHLTARATRLPNLRSIVFDDPLSWEAFLTNYVSITEMALHILTNVPSLARITVCADMLNNEMFRALSQQLYLREVEILLSPVSFYFSNRLTEIGAVLNKGIAQLSQVEYFKIPLDLITDTLLFCLTGLPHLRCLKTGGSVNTPYPARYFISCMGYLHTQNPRIFGNLQLLDVRDDILPREDFFAKDALTKIFPDTKFIET